MIPASAYQARIAQTKFVLGETYRMDVREERSPKSHRHYFACVRKGWMNLPEQYGGRWRNPDELRKYALIATGFRSVTTLVVGSRSQALAVVRQLKRRSREYALYHVYKVKGSTIEIIEPVSQSLASMGKREFGRSKQAVLQYVADLIGVTVEQLTSQKEEDPE